MEKSAIDCIASNIPVIWHIINSFLFKSSIFLFPGSEMAAIKKERQNNIPVKPRQVRMKARLLACIYVLAHENKKTILHKAMNHCCIMQKFKLNNLFLNVFFLQRVKKGFFFL